MTVVDVAFEVRCERLPRDYGYALFRALADELDWLEADAVAAVHPLHGTATTNGSLCLGPRARLTLRLRQEQVAQAMALSGARLDLGSGLDIGPGRLRELVPFATVYSHFVSTGTADELAFIDQAAALLKAAGLPESMIAGKAHATSTPAGEVHGFSLLLHGLTPTQSLAVQESGLGEGRKIGCGIFIPHKSVVAVGAA
ncbi:MAG: type I-MYXAN CRISPR-associated protein Cas6/Cmx6 [Rhodocyclaceae bacterium]|nr:type I-MYXAN CRISPR-associated protein Cas6/Cmx6 [Rhodocyclaceae bacterium]MCB1893189.1 type I-MYXAN CRISPR-associated protein Cas6/Cmx6 [Rhodocyclaceae bacterium]